MDCCDAAVTTLLRAGETDLAYITAQIAPVEDVDTATKRFALKCETLGLVDEAIKLFQELKDGRQQVRHMMLA